MLVRVSLFCCLMACYALSDAWADIGFPRIAGVMIGGPHSYAEPAYQKQLARNDLVILNMWPDWGDREAAVAAIKSINADIRVYLYVNNNELALSDLSYKAVLDKLDSMGWWAYETGSSGTVVNSGWETYKQTNLTSFVPSDSGGLKFSTWIAQWQAANYLVTVPSADGLFEDIFFWKPRVNADWNRDGVTDSRGDVTVQRWWREGYKTYAQAVQRQPSFSGKTLLANVADWGHPDAVLTEYDNLVHGGTFEGAIGFSWSVESWGGWRAMMNWYRKTKEVLKSPKTLIFMQQGTSTDYQGMRYGLASCLMDDGYFFYSSGYGPPQPWFDEYDADLGKPIQGPAVAAWQNGVYRRDFEKGIVLVNPKGNGAQTVLLETEYVKINGTQDRAVNSGAAVQSVTLQDRDGIILMSRNARNAPRPPSDLRVD